MLLGQFKAKTNIQINKYNSEILSNSSGLAQESEVLKQKLREVHKRVLTEEDTLRPEAAVHKINCRIQMNTSNETPEAAKELLAPLLPPSYSAKEIRPRHDTHHNKTSKAGQISPRNFLEHEGVNKSGRKFSENPKSFSFESLKFNARDKESNRIPKVKQSVYHDLLKEKFGFIKPRLK